MSTADRPIVIIACQIMQSMFSGLLPADLADQVIYLDYGLHRVPECMTASLQSLIDAVADPALLVLGYGLCGNGLHGLRSGIHTLLIPRTDDCIAILLGSREAYLREFEAEPGTYYLSRGWLESGSNPLMEYCEYRERYGAEDAAWMMDLQYQNYSRLALVAGSPEEMAHYRSQAKEVAAYCSQWDMRYEEILGSDAYVRRLVQVILGLEEPGTDFLVVPPGGQVQSEDFI